MYELGVGREKSFKSIKLNSFHFSCRYKRNEVNKQIENFNLILLIPPVRHFCYRGRKGERNQQQESIMFRKKVNNARLDGGDEGLRADKEQSEGREKVLIKKLFFFLFLLQCTNGGKKLDKTDEVDKSRRSKKQQRAEG